MERHITAWTLPLRSLYNRVCVTVDTSSLVLIFGLYHILARIATGTQTRTSLVEGRGSSS